ncbi:MAG: WxcM-like domain-containing protein [Candidatus Chisholmbacteria bacterium]|nr:WxcM-like domain-containing protein [Candidatus Chisholmbacteria bacterium]
MLETKRCKLVATKDLNGRVNGKLMEIASSLDGWSRFIKNSQIYLTSVLPRQKKGFHLHRKKTHQITCIKGQVILGVWDGKKITEKKLDGDKPITVRVPKNRAICFYNWGNEEAWLLNLCSPPYKPQDPEQEDLNLSWQPRP